MPASLDPLLTALDRLGALHASLPMEHEVFLETVRRRLADGSVLSPRQRREVFRLLDVYDPVLTAELQGQQRMFEVTP